MRFSICEFRKRVYICNIYNIGNVYTFTIIFANVHTLANKKVNFETRF